MLNRPESAVHVPRLSEVLFEPRESSFASLVSLPTNVEAIEAGLMFCASRNPFVAVVGPSGWGKSHLLHSVGRRLGVDGAHVVEPISACDYVSGSLRPEPDWLILDDVQDVLGKPKVKLGIRLVLERRMRSGRPTFLAFTAPKESRPIKALLPSLRDWTIRSIAEPTAGDRVKLLNQMSLQEGLSLSPRLVRILAEQMHGNGRTLSGALNRLRLSGKNWLLAEDTLRALGILNPFFADNSAWDLKRKVLKIADYSRSQFSRTNALDLALFAMLHKAQLGEADVARAAGITPSEAYRGAARFVKQTEVCDLTATYADQFIELVVSSLAKE